MRMPVGLLMLGLVATGCGGGQPPVVLPGSLAPPALDSVWAEALARYRHGDWRRARIAIEIASAQLAPGDRRIPLARFLVAETQLAMGENLVAVRSFRRVSDDMPNDSLAPRALLRAGDAYADLWRRPELDPTYGQTAKTVYQEAIGRYPGTEAARIAAVRIAELNEKFAIKEYKAGQFYMRFKAYDSAILTFRNLVSDYPRTAMAPEALLKMIEAFRKLGYLEDLQETCNYLVRQHPNADGVGQACGSRESGPEG